MAWSEYCAYFTSEDRGEDRLSKAETLRAWMRDLQGVHGVESFKSKARPFVSCETCETRVETLFLLVKTLNQDSGLRTKLIPNKTKLKDL